MLAKFISNLFFKRSAPPEKEWRAYSVFDPKPAELIGCWSQHFPAYDRVVGYSHLGHIFLLDSETNDYAVLHPFKKAAKSYGQHAGVSAFEANVLKDEAFGLFVLRIEHVASLTNALGPLEKSEIFIPNPYPFLGGSEALDTYTKGDVWVFANLVAEMQGLCE